MANQWKCTNAEYHADTDRIGSSMLKTILKSPRDYYERFVAKTREDKPSDEMILGSAVHCLVLEPDNFDNLFACRPEGIDGRTKQGKEDLAKWRLSAVGKQELTQDANVKAHAIAASVLAAPAVKPLLEGGVREQAITWQEGDLTFKLKADILHTGWSFESDLVVDIKTSSDPSPEAWLSDSGFAPIPKYRYDMQMAHYCRGVTEFTGKRCDAGFIVVGTSHPYDVFVYGMATPGEGVGWLECGALWRQRAIDTLRYCRERNTWLHPAQDITNNLGVTLLGAPSPWHFPPIGDNHG